MALLVSACGGAGHDAKAAKPAGMNPSASEPADAGPENVTSPTDVYLVLTLARNPGEQCSTIHPDIHIAAKFDVIDDRSDHMGSGRLTQAINASASTCMWIGTGTVGIASARNYHAVIADGLESEELPGQKLMFGKNANFHINVD